MAYNPYSPECALLSSLTPCDPRVRITSRLRVRGDLGMRRDEVGDEVR